MDVHVETAAKSMPQLSTDVELTVDSGIAEHIQSDNQRTDSAEVMMAPDDLLAENSNNASIISGTCSPASTLISTAAPVTLRTGTSSGTGMPTSAFLNNIMKNCSLSPAAVNLLRSCEKAVSANATNTILHSYHEMIKNPDNLERAAEYLYEQLVDDATIGVFLEVHHLNKTGNLDALDGSTDGEKSDSSFRIVDKPDYDIFGMSTAKKAMDCTCPNCDRPVSAGRFAKHLAKCMGMDRKSRTSKRLATKEGANASSTASSSYAQMNDGTDEEDEIEDKRRKRNNQNSRNNGKKNGKSF